MCSEADSSRCHRQFIGQELKEGFQVENIKEGKTEKIEQETMQRFI